jgi:hypothetical protein
VAYPGYNPPLAIGSRKRNMKRKAVMMAVACLALMSVTPALAAPPEIEDFCFYQAQQVRFSGRGEREAFIANCIANLTPAPTAKQRRKY